MQALYLCHLSLCPESEQPNFHSQYLYPHLFSSMCAILPREILKTTPTNFNFSTFGLGACYIELLPLICALWKEDVS